MASAEGGQSVAQGSHGNSALGLGALYAAGSGSIPGKPCSTSTSNPGAAAAASALSSQRGYTMPAGMGFGYNLFGYGVPSLPASAQNPYATASATAAAAPQRFPFSQQQQQQQMIAMQHAMMLQQHQRMQFSTDHQLHAARYAELGRARAAVWAANEARAVAQYREEWAERQARIYRYAADCVRDGGGWTAELVRASEARARRPRNQQRRTRSGASSAYRGVCWSKASRKWVATITVQGKNVHLGSWTVEADAARSYDAEVRARFPEERSRLNFPSDPSPMVQRSGGGKRGGARGEYNTASQAPVL